jgi:WD40 repeat protein
MWDVATGQVIAGPFTGHTDSVSSVAFSPDGQRIASASFDCTIRVWDAATGQVTAGPFIGHTESVRSVAFSPDGRHIASASSDCTIRVWDAAPGEAVAGSFSGHTKSVSSVASSQGGPHFTDQSLIDSDGWIYGLGEKKELYLWIPELHRQCLHRPSTIRIVGKHETRLDLSNYVHGSNWATVYHDVYNLS